MSNIYKTRHINGFIQIIISLIKKKTLPNFAILIRVFDLTNIVYNNWYFKYIKPNFAEVEDLRFPILPCIKLESLKS